MSKYYTEKALLSTTNKIESVEGQSGFIKKNINRIINTIVTIGTSGYNVLIVAYTIKNESTALK